MIGIKLSKNKRGFTLVELIVVLVILAVLAALLVPSLTGYIDKAKQQAIISEARGVWTAAQASASECYGLYANETNTNGPMKFTITIDGKTYEKTGRISNSALCDEQNNWNKKDRPSLSASQKIARDVLVYLESQNKSNAQYNFGSILEPRSGQTLKQNMDYIFNNKSPKNAVFVLFFYDQNFKVIGVNFGKDGYLVTMTAKNIKCEKNGKVFTFKEQK